MGSAQVPPTLVRFGVFEADLRAGELRRNGIKVRLQDLPFRALTLLLSRPGEVITRDEFRQALWASDVFVDFEQGISSAVMRLRDALNDSADNPIFIETIERRGYRWIGPILSQTLEPVVQDRAPAVQDRVPVIQDPAPAREPENRDFTARYEIGFAPCPGARVPSTFVGGGGNPCRIGLGWDFSLAVAATPSDFIDCSSAVR